MEDFRDFYNFLRRPDRSVTSDKPFEGRMVDVLKLFAVVFFFMIFIIVPLMATLGLDEFPNKLEELENLGFGSKAMRNLMIFLLAVVVAPIAEEIIFRFPLKFRRGSMFLMCFALIALLVPITRYLGLGGPQGYGFIGVAGLILFYLVLSQHQTEAQLDSFSDRWFPIIFYLTALLFAFAHISNFELPFSKFYMAPVLVLPQLALGILLGYVRLKYGLGFAIFTHALNNFIPSLAVMFM